MAKEITLGIRVDGELDARLKEAAQKDKRSVSSFVRIILADAVKPKPAPEKPVGVAA